MMTEERMGNEENEPQKNSERNNRGNLWVSREKKSMVIPLRVQAFVLAEGWLQPPESKVTFPPIPTSAVFPSEEHPKPERTVFPVYSTSEASLSERRTLLPFTRMYWTSRLPLCEEAPQEQSGTGEQVLDVLQLPALGLREAAPERTGAPAPPGLCTERMPLEERFKSTFLLLRSEQWLP